jgi:hypothetical protein
MDDLRSASPESEARLEEPVPTAGIRDSSRTRAQLVRPSRLEMSPPPSNPRDDSCIVAPGPRRASRDGDPKTTFTHSATRLWVDTCLPPCGSAQAPAPMLSSTRENSTEGLLTVIPSRRCRRPKRLGAKPETVGSAPTASRAQRPRLVTKPPRALAAGCTRVPTAAAARSPRRSGRRARRIQRSNDTPARYP